MKRLDIVKEARAIHVVSSLLFALAGVFLLVWPEIGTLISRYLIGGCFILFGLARLLGYFSNDLYRLAFQYDLGLGGFCAVFGVLSIISPDNIQMVLPYTIGVYVLIDSLLKLQTAFDAKAFGMKHWYGLLISALLLILSAITLMVMTPKLHVPAFVPVVLILHSAESIWNTLGTVRVRAKKAGRFEELL
ncbi:MAG: DUF308 domain-containing protein [Ruminococcaceae bacterium]|nr:DUF308 domain-containing protein [Oscillospiraceae bacterium]